MNRISDRGSSRVGARFSGFCGTRSMAVWGLAVRWRVKPLEVLPPPALPLPGYRGGSGTIACAASTDRSGTKGGLGGHLGCGGNYRTGTGRKVWRAGQRRADADQGATGGSGFVAHPRSRYAPGGAGGGLGRDVSVAAARHPLRAGYPLALLYRRHATGGRHAGDGPLGYGHRREHLLRGGPSVAAHNVAVLRHSHTGLHLARPRGARGPGVREPDGDHLVLYRPYSA